MADEVMPPGDGNVDVGKLATLFADVTASYKFLLFQAILNTLQERRFEGKRLPLEELAVGMLLIASHPVRYFKLSLGVWDQVSSMLSEIDYAEDGDMSDADVRTAIAVARVRPRRLLRYVPTRLLTPWFDEELRGIDRRYKGQEIARLADERFQTTKPLYRLVGDELELHPEWVRYIRINLPIVSGWAERRWIAFLQSKNPTVPAIPDKIRRPVKRAALTGPARYWSAVMGSSAEPLRCVYSGCPIDPSRFDIDHFLPWSFVCHDAPWNLVPTIPGVNASKGNRLPSKTYLDGMVRMQHQGLAIAIGSGLPRSLLEPVQKAFVGDLRVPKDRLLDRQALEDAYKRSVVPLLDLAAGVGFRTEWHWINGAGKSAPGMSASLPKARVGQSHFSTSEEAK